MKNKILIFSLFLFSFIFILNNSSYASFNIDNEVFLNDTVILNEESINLKNTNFPYTILKCTYGIGGTTYVKNTGYLLVINNTYTKDNCNFSVVNASGSGQLAKIYCFNSSTYNLKNNYYYTYDISSNTWVYYTTNTEDLNIRYDQSYTFYFSNIDIYKALGYNKLKHTFPSFIIDNGTVIFNKSGFFYDYNITLSTTEDTVNPITAYSNYFNYEDALNYQCYISTDAANWTSMNIKTFTDTSDNTTKVRFFYHILENGTYHFKFLNKETNKEEYISKTITNIISDSHLSDSNGIPSPHVTYKKHSDFFTLKTQSFNENDIQKYTCYYIKLTDDLDVSTFPNFNWSEMGIGTFTNTQLNQLEYYYFFQVPLDSENCTYIFAFQDNSTGEYGSITTLTCDFSYMNDYSDKVQGVVEEKQSKFDELLDFFKERFGFLTFPFEFIADLLNRILNIEYKEPIIRIPEIKIPGTENVIFNSYEYNFNTLLENDALSNIYDIYLIAVDFIIIIGVVILAKNTLMEVFGNG